MARSKVVLALSGLLCAALVFACSSASSPTGTGLPTTGTLPTPSNGALATPLETAGPSEAPTAPVQTPSGGTPLPTLPSFEIPSFTIPSFSFTPDTQLESLFPKTIAGKPVKVQSLHVRDIQTTFESNPKSKKIFQEFLAALGKTIDDVSIAFGSVELTSGLESIVAARVAGADPGTLLQGGITVTIAQKTHPENWASATATVGGKNVATLTDTTDPHASVEYLYPYGEVVFIVDTDKTDVAATLVSALP